MFSRPFILIPHVGLRVSPRSIRDKTINIAAFHRSRFDPERGSLWLSREIAISCRSDVALDFRFGGRVLSICLICAAVLPRT
jgi:hypothetical protein